MMKKTFGNFYLILLLASLLLLLTSCNSIALKPYQQKIFAMDTVVDIHLYAPNQEKADQAFNEVEKTYRHIAAMTTRFPTSDQAGDDQEILKINNHPGQPIAVSDELWNLLLIAQKWSEKTQGAFDISLGGIMDLWDFQNNPHIPSDELLQEALKNCGYQKIIMNAASQTITIPQGMKLDLGGIAKGYATDKAADALRALDIKHALINGGGNVYALGRQPNGEPWQIGIRHPRLEDQVLEIVEAADQSVITSGDYQRYFLDEKGQRWHHIIDPQTGKPANKAISVTIICNSSTEGDILSTALFVMGNKQGKEFAKNLPQIKTIFYEDK